MCRKDFDSHCIRLQDGSIESGIPSTELFPIHHLDEHEYFVGDFVAHGDDGEEHDDDYGVVQEVDHLCRTAKVQWYKTYTFEDDPRC